MYILPVVFSANFEGRLWREMPFHNAVFGPPRGAWRVGRGFVAHGSWRVFLCRPARFLQPAWQNVHFTQD